MCALFVPSFLISIAYFNIKLELVAINSLLLILCKSISNQYLIELIWWILKINIFSIYMKDVYITNEQYILYNVRCKYDHLNILFTIH